MPWYYVVSGQRQGPASTEQFEKLVAEGVVTDETIVSADGATAWQTYATARGAGPKAEEGTEVCAVSGRPYPRAQMIHYEGRWISAEHRDAFFQRLREGVHQPLVGDSTMPGPHGYGGFWRRAAAFAIDAVITQTVVYLVSLPFERLERPASLQLSVGWGLLLVDWSISTAIDLTYTTCFLRLWSATPGKMALGLKVLRADGTRLSLGRCVARYAAAFLSGLVLGIGHIMAAFNPEKRTLHDNLCDTRVIRTR